AHGRNVDVDYVNGAHDIVRGDPARLRQLFLVLLDNAVRYSKSKGEVKVEVGSDGGEVTVRVSDRRIGIPGEQIQGLFGPSRRGGRAWALNAEGLALGLPVAR